MLVRQVVLQPRETELHPDTDDLQPTELQPADPVRGGRWASRDLFAADADVTVYWPDVRPCYDR